MLGLGLVGCGSDDNDNRADNRAVTTAAGNTQPSGPEASPAVPTTTLGPPPPAGIFTVGPAGVDLLSDPGGAVVGRIREGVVLPYDKGADGFFHVTTPCDGTAWVPAIAGQATGPYRVVLDPGHGGDEPGAVGPSGLTEKELNLDIAGQAAEILNAEGVPAVLTRAGDYRATLRFRIQVAKDAGAEVFVSLHHNAEPDEQRRTPGTEAYFQSQSADSKRLTGLVYEEVFTALSAYDITFAADFDAGAKFRVSEAGNDYYGVIRRSFEAGIVGTLLESGFVSNPEEEALLRRDDVRRAEAQAIATGVQRYLRGEQPGDVFTEPYPRTTPAGPGGGAAGCENPA